MDLRDLRHWLPCLIAAAGTACGVAAGPPRSAPVQPGPAAELAEGPPFTPFADSFVNVHHGSFGSDTGWLSVRFEATASGYRLTQALTAGGSSYRTTQVYFGPDLTVDSVQGTGERLGRTVDWSVSYTGRRATGWYATGAAHTSPRIGIDALMPDSAFDVSALMAILPTLRWAVGMKRTLFEFGPTTGTTQTRLLSVVGEEQVTVPAGTFDAFKAELTAPYFLEYAWYTRSLPHRCVKVIGVTDNWTTELVH